MSEEFDTNDKNIIDGYEGLLNSNASHRSFIDIQPNISVRTEMNRRDYNRFRQGEMIPDDSKSAIKMCMEAYNKVGIIKNVIDLMGDFASQGITINHTDKKIQTFYRNWWKLVKGSERSERFLNTLYRCGNVILRRRYGKLTKKLRQNMAKAMDTIEIEKLETAKYNIPCQYDMLNPLQVSVKGGAAAIFFGKPIYEFNISQLVSEYAKLKEESGILETLPESIREALKSEDKKLELDQSNLMIYHYKKDDWQLWANPMIYAILDDIVMFEKMKLADSAALDGAISNIRLWRLGSLEHKIMPSRAAVDKLRDILASNVGGGTMDLVWGPEIEFQESATQIYKFLGNEKYEPILNSIYAGLGIPPTLTGLAGQSGGYTNNFVSLKTLIDRLEYGRSLLADFWNKELRLIQKAMGFKAPARLHFENMLVADEAAEKNLLIALADRGFISLETLRERLGEDTSIENSRLKTEFKEGKKKDKLPMAGPFFNGNVEAELAKIALQKGLIGIQDITDIDPKHAPPMPEFKPSAPNGRPPFKKDAAPRKQRVAKPKTSPTMADISIAMMWLNEAQKKISSILDPVMFEYFNKKNLRDLTKSERTTLDNVKLSVLSNLPLYAEINKSSIAEANRPINKDFQANIKRLVKEYIGEKSNSPSTEEMHQIISLSYITTFFE